MKISATSGKISENIGKCRKNENIADPDFDDNIANIAILS
jgi:hypothetical protein